VYDEENKENGAKNREVAIPYSGAPGLTLGYRARLRRRSSQWETGYVFWYGRKPPPFATHEAPQILDRLLDPRAQSGLTSGYSTMLLFAADAGGARGGLHD
jgi:hypothetical protein